jgi:PleD family two-component response regulator
MSYTEASTETHKIDLNFIHSEAALRPTRCKKKILIVDDDREITQILQASLSQYPKYDVLVANDPFEAMNLLSNGVFDLVLLDWHLPKFNGLKTIIETEKLFRFDPTLPIEWYGKKVQVVTFSSDEVTQCKFVNTRHFKYVGHVHKKNSLSNIVGQLNNFLELA